jgi:hypothetical protein
MSPFVSKAQQRLMFSQHPEIARRWAKVTPDIKALPQHVRPQSGRERLVRALARRSR